MQPRLNLPKPQPSFRFDELGILVTVAEAGSLSAAAKQLGVPKSTVGRAIARLEDELGVSLVRRMARGPTLTEPGLVLANRAAPHIAGLRDAAIAQGRESQEAYGLLRVTAPADIGAHLIAPCSRASSPAIRAFASRSRTRCGWWTSYVRDSISRSA